MKPQLAIFTGDPKGIGPELVQRLLKVSLPGGIHQVTETIQTTAEFRIFGPRESNPNLAERSAAEMTLASLKEAVKICLAEKIPVLVTGPVNKKRLRLVDPNFVGMSEFLAQHCGREICALFVAKELKVALVTRHLGFREIVSYLNAVEILRTIRMTHTALVHTFGIEAPRLAVCGLNPHAGEGGIFGTEETKIIAPAIQQAKKEGIEVSGPSPADTVFWEARSGKYDAVVALYHDQGLIPIKTLAFNEACQMTLGLPFLRIGVDHGTAEPLVGTGKADPSSLKSAIHLACELAKKC